MFHRSGKRALGAAKARQVLRARTLCGIILLAGAVCMAGACDAFHSIDRVRDPWDPEDDATADATYLGTPAQGSEQHTGHTLDSDDVADWFAFSLEPGVTYSLLSTGADGVLVGELFRMESGIPIAAGTGKGSTCNGNFAIRIAVQASGRYYLRVRTDPVGEVATYSLQYFANQPLSPDAWDPEDDTPSAATVLTSETPLAQQGMYHTLSASDIVDWYAIYLAFGRTYEFSTILRSGDTTMEILGSPSGPTLVSDDDSGGGLASRVVFSPEDEGWYYIAVRAYARQDTEYQLTWSVTEPQIHGDPWDGFDDTSSGATVLPTATVFPTAHGPHTLGGSDSADWFTLYLVAGATYQMEGTAGSGDTYAYLYWVSDTGISYVASDDDSGEGSMFRVRYAPARTGWYLLCVETFAAWAQATYTLSYSTVSK